MTLHKNIDNECREVRCLELAASDIGWGWINGTVIKLSWLQAVKLQTVNPKRRKRNEAN